MWLEGFSQGRQAWRSAQCCSCPRLQPRLQLSGRGTLTVPPPGFNVCCKRVMAFAGVGVQKKEASGPLPGLSLPSTMSLSPEIPFLLPGLVLCGLLPSRSPRVTRLRTAGGRAGAATGKECLCVQGLCSGKHVACLLLCGDPIGVGCTTVLRHDWSLWVASPCCCVSLGGSVPLPCLLS